MHKNKKLLALFSMLAMLIGISAGAQAQNRRKVTVEAAVPFEFMVGDRTFPAGTYVFEMATGSPKSTDESGVLVIRNRDRRLYAAVETDVAHDQNAHVSPKIVFARSGDRAYLANVWHQGSAAGLALHTPSITGDWQESELVTLDAYGVNGGI